MNKEQKIKEIGYIEKGTGKHQSNIVYESGGLSPTLCAGLGIKNHIMIIEKNEDKNKASN